MDVSSINGAHSGIGALWQKGNFCFWVKTKNLGCDIQIQSPTADLKSNLVSSLTIYHFHLCHKHFKIMSNSTMRFEYETCGDLFCKENTLRCFTDVRKVITPAVIYSRVDFHWDYFMYQLFPFKIWCCIPCDNALIIYYSLGVKTTGETSAIPYMWEFDWKLQLDQMFGSKSVVVDLLWDPQVARAPAKLRDLSF